jgi:ribonuclease HI
MIATRPHYLLVTSSEVDDYGAAIWRFTLQEAEGQTAISASDREPDILPSSPGKERLELLAVVRGLEALDQPTDVTLVTSSRYVSRGMQYGLDEWRESDWRWERFGRLAPVKDDDLWQRLDRALTFHCVVCYTTRAQNIRAAAVQSISSQFADTPSSEPGERHTRQVDPGQGRRRGDWASPSRRPLPGAALAHWRERWRRTAAGLSAAASLGELGGI